MDETYPFHATTGSPEREPVAFESSLKIVEATPEQDDKNMEAAVALTLLIQAPFHAALEAASPDHKTTDTSEPQWKTTTFHISEAKLLRKGVGHTKRTRLMAAASVIQRNPIAHASLAVPRGKNLDTSLTMLTDDYLAVKVPIGRQRIARQDVLHRDVMLEVMEATLRAQNDPIIQLHNQITAGFGDQLTSLELNMLKEDLLLSTKHLFIRAVYASVIRTVREATPA